MVVRKRQIIAAALVLALGSAVFINWYYNRPSVKSTNARTRKIRPMEAKPVGEEREREAVGRGGR